MDECLGLGLWTRCLVCCLVGLAGFRGGFWWVLGFVFGFVVCCASFWVWVLGGWFWIFLGWDGWGCELWVFVVFVLGCRVTFLC